MTPRATPEEDLKWHFVAHTSLDIFEERGMWQLSRLVKLLKPLEGLCTEATNVRQSDHYAGLLQVMDDYAV